MDIAIEAAELMELFVWATTPEQQQEILEKKRTEIEHEVVDVLWGVLLFCNRANIDLATAFERKYALNAQRYPVEKAKGLSSKYSDF